MIVFEKAGKDNTEETIKIAVERAQKLNTSIVIASNTGYTAGTLVRFLEENKIELPVVVVTAVYGMSKPGENQFPEEQRKELKSKGVEIVTAAHALSGAERSFSNRFHGQGPIEIMAHTLRMLSQGVKVGVECATMALDAGAVPYGTSVVSVGGTGRGADSAIVTTAAYTHSILDTKIHEILCKPY